MELHCGADIHPAAHRGPHTRAGALKEAAVHEDPVLEQGAGRN